VNLVSLIAVYFVVWWIVLFAVLPWGVRSQEEEGDTVLGTMPGAPARPMMVRRIVATSLVTAVLVGLVWLAVDVYGLSLATIADRFDLRQ
jgi:predicted secreted protein